MFKKAVFIIFCAAVLTGSLAETGRTQESAIIQATATVLASLTITGTNDLQFGAVTPGVDKSVDKSATGFAGEWEIQGLAGAEITLDFSLPDSLVLIDSTVIMPIVFSSTDASFSDGSGSQVAPTGVVNPNGPLVEFLGGTGEMTVWIGGTVQPTISQTGGDYAADVILTVAYTGG